MSTSRIVQSLEPSCQTEKSLTKLKKESKRYQCEAFSSTSKGLFVGFISGFLYSWMQVIVKHLKIIHPAQLTAYRYLAISSCILPELVLSHENPLGHPSSRLSILILSISSAVANFLIFAASRNLPLGEASALASCNPVFITVAGRIFLKESLGLVQVIALLVTIVGMVFITGVYQTLVQNSRVYTNENIYGLAAALGSIIFATVHLSLTRKLVSKNVHHSAVLFLTGIVGVIVSIILTALLGNFNFHCDRLENDLIIFLGVLSYLALLTLTVAARYAESGPVSTMRAASDIFFSFLWQTIMFRDIPDAITIFGAILACIAIALVGFSQKLNAVLTDKFKNCV